MAPLRCGAIFVIGIHKMLRQGRKYVSKAAVFAALGRLGYEEEPVATRSADAIHFWHKSPEHEGWPETLTLSYFEVSFDGTLWFDLEIVFDLLDRLSGSEIEADIAIRLMKQLENEAINVKPESSSCPSEKNPD